MAKAITSEIDESLVARIDPLTSDDRRVIERELADSPATASLIRSLLATGGPHAVADFARKAYYNEIDPSLFPETKGYWPALRAQVRKLLVALPAAMRGAADEMSLNDKLKFAEQIAQGKRLYLSLTDYPVEDMMGLGQFEIIGSIVSGVAGAASSIYSAKVVADAQKAIAKIQADAQLKQLNVSMTLAKAQAAVTGAQTQILQQTEAGTLPAGPSGAPTGGSAASAIQTIKAPTGSVTATVKSNETVLDKKVGGIPLWSIGLTAVGGILFAFK